MVRVSGTDEGETSLLAEVMALRIALEVKDAQLEATRAVLAVRESELLLVKGSCTNLSCRLHLAHAGPCDVVGAAGTQVVVRDDGGEVVWEGQWLGGVPPFADGPGRDE